MLFRCLSTVIVVLGTASYAMGDRLGEIETVIRKSRGAVEHLSVAYRYRLDYESAKVTLRELQAVTVSEDVKCVFFGPKTYFEGKGFCANKGGLLPLDRTASWDGRNTRLISGATYYLQIPESNFAFDNAYFCMLGWARSVKGRSDAALGLDCWLPEGLQSRKWRLVRDGANAVIERSDPAMTVELAQQYHFAIVSVAVGGKAPGKYTCTDFVPIASGRAFMPRRIEGSTVIRDYHGSSRVGPISFKLDVTDINDRRPSDAVFAFKPTPGMMVSDQVKRLHYTFQPVGENTLDDAATEVAKLLPYANTPRPESMFWGWVQVASLTVLGVALVIVVATRLRRGYDG